MRSRGKKDNRISVARSTVVISSLFIKKNMSSLSFSPYRADIIFIRDARENIGSRPDEKPQHPQKDGRGREVA
jgi:hypothetical protein